MNIWIAASDGRQDLVEKYLASGLSAVAKDPNGYTPMHAAAAYSHLQLLEFLVNKHNGDINVRDEDGDTPLHHVEDVATAKFVIEQLHADPNLRNNEHLTALDNVLQDSDSDPQLIEYLKSVTLKDGQHGNIQEQLTGLINEDELNQFKENVKLSLATEVPQDEESLQRQKRLQEIMNGDNVDENLEQYITEIIHEQLLNQVNPKRGHEDQADSNKRSRN
ncbi:hypothetical protein ACO0RG_003068 [Hanseniaspora osmophila]|uniref:Ankyrin repeat-containing protein n=1 Tax=Hanseniaspora osmophila TaxID=56408 RepID=A0A1E5REK0_9ASCO|nr:Ankyrin repeat-containing protein [Hanseniaspora osmophila]